MAARKWNHSGIDIYIPSEAKQEAVLTLPDGEDVRVGQKHFDTFDEFKVWLDEQAQQLSSERNIAQRTEARAKVMKREVDETEASIGNLKREDFDSTEEFIAATSQKLDRLRQVHSDLRTAENEHNGHCKQCDAIKSVMKEKEKPSAAAKG